MTTTIRTPDQITDIEIARAAWIARGEAEPVERAFALLSPLTPFGFLRPELHPDAEAWGPESESARRLRERIVDRLADYRAYTTPVVLTSRVGRDLVERLAALCWRHGIVSWDNVGQMLDAYPHVRDLAEALGWPESLSLAEIVPAVDAAWWEIAREAIV